MSDLIFGKDKTQKIVGCEPGNYDKCVLFIQNDDGSVYQRHVPMSHWILYTEQHSPKFKELTGNQPYKYLMEFDNLTKYEDVLKQSRFNQLDNFICRDPKEAFMVKNGVTLFKGMKLEDVSVCAWDLEHSYGIGETPAKNGRLLIISNTYRDSFGVISKKSFFYDEYTSEAEMVEAWCDFICEIDPTILTGHNLFRSDLKLMKHVSKKHKVALKLGRNKSELKFEWRKSTKRKDGSQSYDFVNCHCYGREIVDGYFLALDYDILRNYPSYGLKAIVEYEGLGKKDRVHYDASKIAENYLIPEEWEKIKAYGADDADDSLAYYLFAAPAFFYFSQSVPRSFQHLINSATGSQMNGIMLRGYLQQGHSIAKASDAVPYPGAISFGIPGIHRNVCRFDVSGMYPAIMLQYRIYNSVKDPQCLLLEMLKYFNEERQVNKKIAKETDSKHHKGMSESQKRGANSVYGFCGAGRLSYNYPEGAAEVTRYGREILSKSIVWATGQPIEVVKTFHPVLMEALTPKIEQEYEDETAQEM